VINLYILDEKKLSWTIVNMFNWIRWHLTQVIIGIVAFALIAGGIYTLTSISKADSKNITKTQVDSLVSCETTECVNDYIAKVPSDELMSVYESISKFKKSLLLYPKDILASGPGICYVASVAIGERVAQTQTIKDLPTMITKLGVESTNRAEGLAFPCQFGFMDGYIKIIASKTSVDERKAAISTMCPTLNADDTRSRFGQEDSFCIRAVSVLSTFGNIESREYSNVVSECDILAGVHAAPCYQASVLQWLFLIPDAEVKFSDCKSSKMALYCEMMASMARTYSERLKVLPAITLTELAAADIPSGNEFIKSFDSICTGAVSNEACESGFYIGINIHRSTIGILCKTLGAKEEMCNRVSLTFHAEEQVRNNDLVGNTLSANFCTEPMINSEYLNLCQAIVNDIVSYNYQVTNIT